MRWFAGACSECFSVLEIDSEILQEYFEDFKRHHESFTRVSRDFRVALSMGWGVCVEESCTQPRSCVCCNNIKNII